MNPTTPTTPASPTTARDAYLAWQAAIGGDEVVLTAPWVRPTANPTANPLTQRSMGTIPNPPSPPSHSSSSSSPASASIPSPVSTDAGSDFFSAIAEKLAKADPLRRDARVPNKSQGGTEKTGVSERSAVAAPALPDFADLNAYWTWLEEVYPKWFPGAGPLTRAAGYASPRLAVVELYPSFMSDATGSEDSKSPDGLFSGAPGALLDRMLHAIGLRREDLYMTSLMKTSPPGRSRGSDGGARWARKDTARMVPALLRELRLAGCELVLLAGESCAQAVLKTGRSIPELLKSATETDGLSLSATWHPAEILRGDAAHAASSAKSDAKSNGGAENKTDQKPDKKAERPLATQAWEHLQWLRGLLPARGS